MDGLMVYKQYLENIRLDIKNYELQELQSKSFLDILKRVREIEDLSYIDIILKNAGLDLSFIQNKDFLNKKVIVKSKLESQFVSDSMDEDMQEALSEYLAEFTSQEDLVLAKLNSIFGEDGIELSDTDYLPESETEVFDTNTLIEKHKDTLSALFGSLSKMTEEPKIEKSEVEELQNINDKKSENISLNIEKFEDIEEDLDKNDSVENNFSESFEEDLDDSESIEENLDSIEDIEESYENFESEVNEFEENMPDEDIKTQEFENKNFDLFLDNEEDVENNEDSEEVEDENYDENQFIPQAWGVSEEDIGLTKVEDIHDKTGLELAEELKEDDFFDYQSLDPADKAMLENSTHYFLNGTKNRVKPSVQEIKELAKKEEKLVDLDEVTAADDTMAKVLLSLGAGVLNLPNVAGNLLSKLKEGSKKMRENIIVEDDEDGE